MSVELTTTPVAIAINSEATEVVINPSSITINSDIAATIEIGTVTDGDTASVTNSGTPQEAVFDIVLPRGADGTDGTNGTNGTNGANGIDGIDGVNGWSPIFATASDGERRVLQVTDWTGGTTGKPASGKYVGASGFVDLIADGVDIRGESTATTGIDEQIFDTSGTWEKPVGAKKIKVRLWAGGNGGNGGSLSANNSNRAGGAGACAGQYLEYEFNASVWADSVAVTVGAGGNGGNGATTSTTAGAAGAIGGNSSFGDLVAFAAPVAATPTITTNSTSTPSRTHYLQGLEYNLQGTNRTGEGRNGSTGAGLAAVGTPANVIPTPHGGASGGGLTTANTDVAGGAANAHTFNGNTLFTQKTGGIVDGARDGANGSDMLTATIFGYVAGQGGAGGASEGDGVNTPGNGGNGGKPGAGGGGGGSGSNGSPRAGNGGNGGNGRVIVTTYF